MLVANKIHPKFLDNSLFSEKTLNSSLEAYISPNSDKKNLDFSQSGDLQKGAAQTPKKGQILSKVFSLPQTPNNNLTFIQDKIFIEASSFR